MNPENIYENPSVKRKNLIVAGLGVLGFFILVGVGIFFILQEEKIFTDLQGNIYLTLANKNDTATNLYALDTKTGVISDFFDAYGEVDFSDRFVAFTNRFSPRGDLFAYSVAVLDRNVPDRFSTWLRLYVYNSVTKEYFSVGREN